MKNIRLQAIAGVLWLSLGQACLAQSRQAAQPTFSQQGPRFQQTTGEALFKATCQGCHMSKGEGAKGAAAYPPLAGNPRLASPEYTAYVVLNGLHGMPPFGKMMSDAQIAAVVNYTRTAFGNKHPGSLTEDAVRKMRQPAKP